MKIINKLLLTGIFAFTINARSLKADDRAPLLAKIEQSGGLMMPPEHNSDPVFVGRVIEVTEDGKVYVASRYLKNGKTLIKTSQPLTYKQADIVEFKRSINQLKVDRPLVEDEMGPCDGGFTHYTVVVHGQAILIQENNDCMPNKIRQGRSWLEVAVINVLTDLLAAYYKLPQK